MKDNEIYFLQFEGFLAAVNMVESKSAVAELKFFHLLHFRSSLISSQQQSETKVFDDMFSAAMPLGALFHDKKPAKHTRPQFKYQPSEVMTVSLKTISNSANFSNSVRVEASDSLIFIRGVNSIGFADILSKYNTTQKPTNNKALHSTTSQALEDETSKIEEQTSKMKLINYQELAYSEPKYNLKLRAKD